MTDLLYQTDSYVDEFRAIVVEVDSQEKAIAVNQTAFYPGGGGQPSDVGWLLMGDEVVLVTKVKRQGELVWHWLDGPLPAIGAKVIGRLDWDRRYKLMRTHTALHILCGVVWRDYGASVTGSNMEPLKGRMDFEFESMNRELVKEIEQKANLEIERGRDVRVNILPRDEAFQIPDLIRTKINLLPEGMAQVRTVEIVGLDLQADGGTHVANTGEVGHLMVTDYKSKGRINKRIHIGLDE